MPDVSIAEALHKATLECLDAFSAKRDTDKIAKLRDAVAGIPLFTDNPFAQPKVVREWGQSETSWHAVVLATARRWVEDNRHCEMESGALMAPSSAGNCKQLVTLPMLNPTPSEVRAELEAEMNRVRVAASPAPPSEPSPANDLLAFVPGAFIYHGHKEKLTGKPLQVLKALWQAQGKTLTLDALQSSVWTDSTTGQETVRSAVSAARQALRKAFKARNIDGPADPLPLVDRGLRLTAWRLALP